jgi:hypothetical protein
MKAYKFIIPVVLTVIAMSFGQCKKDTNDAQNAHTLLDNQDNQTLATIQSETGYAQSSNSSLIHYHDSLNATINPSLILHYSAMERYYDDLYHQSDSLCTGYANHLNNIHTCGMMSTCQSIMGGNGGMMGGSSGGTYHCSLMSRIINNCSSDDDLHKSHSKYCLR